MESSWDYYFPQDGYHTVLFQVALGFALGLILAPFSVGLLIFLVFYFIFELFYLYRVGFRYTLQDLIARFAIFLYALLGFLFGRWASGDNNPFRMHYDSWDYSGSF